MASKKGSKGRYTRTMIYIIMASFVLGGLFTGYGMPKDSEGVDNSPQSKWNILVYESESVATQPVACNILEATGDVKVVVANAGALDDDIISEVFDANITGVKSTVLEVSPSYAMFHMKVDGDEARKGISDRIRIPGMMVYDVYMCGAQGERVEVIGRNLTVGDEVSVLLVERTRAGFREYVGFMQEKVS